MKMKSKYQNPYLDMELKSDAQPMEIGHDEVSINVTKNTNARQSWWCR